MKKILIINGPNLNMLGKRPKEHYGSLTLNEINNLIKKEVDPLEFELKFVQSNYEGRLISAIQKAVVDNTDAIIINPACYTHTSVGIHDALEMFNGLKVEVHLSHVDDREDFRKVNFVRSVCNVCFSGKHEASYIDAIRYLKNNL